MFNIIRGTILLIVLLAMMTAFIGLGGLSLCVASIKYDWMIEHGMNTHAYGMAALAIAGEIIGLLYIRRGVMLAYALVQITYFSTEEKEEQTCTN